MQKNEAIAIVEKLEWRKGQIPYDGVSSNDDHDYRWYKVNNRAETEALLELFSPTLLCHVNSLVEAYPEWICVEADGGFIDFDTFDLDGEISITSLSYCKGAFQRLLEAVEGSTAAGNECTSDHAVESLEHTSCEWGVGPADGDEVSVIARFKHPETADSFIENCFSEEEGTKLCVAYMGTPFS